MQRRSRGRTSRGSPRRRGRGRSRGGQSPNASRIARLKENLFGRVDAMFRVRSGKRLRRKDRSFVMDKLDAVVRKGGSSDRDLRAIVEELRLLRVEEDQALKARRFAEQAADSSAAAEPEPETTSGPAPKAVVMEDMWAALNAKDVEVYNRQMVASLAKARSQKKTQREILDEQVAAAKARREEAALSERHWSKRILEDKTAFEAEQEAVRQKKIDRVRLERSQRQEQLQERERRVRDMEEQRRLEESLALKKLNQEVEEDRQRELEKKRRERARLEEQKRFNEEERLRRDEERRLAMEEDIRLQQQYIERLEREERARQENFARIYKRQAQHHQMGMKTFKTLDEKAKEDEMRALREQKLINDEKERLFREKLQQMRRDRVEMRATLASQINSKKEAVRQAHQERVDEGARILREQERAIQLERKRKLERRRRNVDNRKLLEAQIHEQHEAQRTQGFMSETEKRLNSNLLKDLFVEGTSVQ